MYIYIYIIMKKVFFTSYYKIWNLKLQYLNNRNQLFGGNELIFSIFLNVQLDISYVVFIPSNTFEVSFYYCYNYKYTLF